MPTSKTQLIHRGDQWELTLVIDPVPAARPRVGKWGTYYPRTYSRFMQQADAQLRLLKSKLSDETMYVSVCHVVRKPKTGKLPHPNGDVDNFLKGSLDAITKAQLIWHDDKQIKTVFSDKRYALGSEQPRIFVRVGLTLGVLWLAEPIVEGEDILDVGERECKHGKP